VTVELDHIAIAGPDSRELIELLAGRLGGAPLFGREAAGFRWMLLRLGDGVHGMNVEILEPWRTEENPFLERFLARRGTGPHHLTFKTEDLRGMIDRLREANFDPADIDLSDPHWQEAFIRPAHAFGTIVQVAASDLRRPGMDELVLMSRNGRADELNQLAGGGGQPPRIWWDPPSHRGQDSVQLVRVVLAVDELTGPLRLYRDLLRGRVIGRDRESVDLAWSGGQIRLERNAEHPAGVMRLEAVASTSDVTLSLGSAELVISPRSA
jgi:hypothetical protein